MSGSAWTEAEFQYLVKLAVDGGVSVHEAVRGINSHFAGAHRTYDGAIGALRSRGLSLNHLRSERQAAIQAEADAKAKASPPLELAEEMEQTFSGPKGKALTEAEMRQTLSGLGYKIEKLSKDKCDRAVPLDMSMFVGDEIRFGALSCSHIGSKFQQITYLTHFYKYCEDMGIKNIFHCGDMVDGINVYPGHEFEVFLHGFDAQRDYCVENYPRIEGGKTWVVAGNHDYSFIKEGGADIVADIASEREDIQYLGAYGAYPQIGPNRIYLQHGGGKPAYALSYHMQKNIERMTPAAKPNIYLLGHFHASCVLPEYRNVVAFSMASFQAQTPHARRFSLFAEVGGLIITMKINDFGHAASLADITFRWVPFYVPKDHDY